MSDKVKEEIRLDIGMGWLVQYEYDETWMDFKAYEIVGLSHKNDEVWYAGKTENMTQDLEEAECLAGHIKWDGCSEFYLEQQHFCGAKDLDQYCRAMKAIHELCLKLPRVDEELAGYNTEGGERSETEKK